MRFQYTRQKSKVNHYCFIIVSYKNVLQEKSMLLYHELQDIVKRTIAATVPPLQQRNIHTTDIASQGPMQMNRFVNMFQSLHVKLVQ